jgi:hypothetical protein
VRSERWLGRTEFRPKDYMRTLVGDDEFVQPKRNETAPRSERRPTLKNALTQPRLLEMDVKPAYRRSGYRVWLEGRFVASSSIVDKSPSDSPKPSATCPLMLQSPVIGKFGRSFRKPRFTAVQGNVETANAGIDST